MRHLDPSPREPVDPDVDLHSPGEVRAIRRTGDAAVLAAISGGGAIGAVARYLIGQVWPTPVGGFPWPTFAINVAGCALIGVLMVLVSEVFTEQRLLRPFVGTGILGGFTTFSTYAVDVQHLIDHGHGGTALLYLTGTLLGALAAVWTTARLTRALVNGRTR